MVGSQPGRATQGGRRSSCSPQREVRPWPGSAVGPGSPPEEGRSEGMAFGWMFRDSEGLPYYRIVEGEGLPNAVDAGIQYWQGLRRHRTSLTREGMFPYIYESEFKLKTTNLGLPKQALLTDSYNWAWALEKASQ